MEKLGEPLTQLFSFYRWKNGGKGEPMWLVQLHTVTKRQIQNFNSAVCSVNVLNLFNQALAEVGQILHKCYTVFVYSCTSWKNCSKKGKSCNRDLMWSTKFKIFTIRPFTEKCYHPLLHTIKGEENTSNWFVGISNDIIYRKQM